MREGIYVERDLPDGELYTGFELFWEDGKLNTRPFTSCTLAFILRNSIAFKRGDDGVHMYDVKHQFKMEAETIEKMAHDTPSYAVMAIIYDAVLAHILQQHGKTQ